MKKAQKTTANGDNKKQYKIKRYRSYECEPGTVYLPDLIAIMAANVEEAYITAGITDYTAHDCFDKGFLLALAMFKDTERAGQIEYRIEYYSSDERSFDHRWEGE